MESGHEQLQRTHTDIIEFTQGIVDDFKELAQERGITLKVVQHEKKLLASFDLDKMEKVLTTYCLTP